MSNDNSFRELLNDALDSFKSDYLNIPEHLDEMSIQERKDLYELLESDEPHDMIFECADSNVPVYNGDILDYAADDVNLALDEPELGAAFDGSPTPINIIAANIFEAIEAKLWEWWQDERESLMNELEELGIEEEETEA